MIFYNEMEKAAVSYGLSFTEKQMKQFQRYYELLLEWNQKMNLTAITDPREVAVKHIIDSLAGWNEKKLAEDASLIDIGTGAGFPGIPLKIFQSNLHLTLLDSLNKRVNFLRAVVGELGLNGVECIHGRAEEAARDKRLRECFDIVVSRAVARLPTLAEYCLPFARVGGVFLAWKGLQYREEAGEAKKAIRLLGGGDIKILEIHLPGFKDVRAVLSIPKVNSTPEIYPRKAGMPTKKPL